MLELYLDHWTGEWKSCCNSIYNVIWSNLDKEEATPKTPAQWKQLLRSNNHKALALAFKPTDTGMLELSKISKRPKK
jgi:hypothetical protein